MAPFSMRCTNCHDYIYKGKKFNARKETTNEEYLSIKIFRFYIRCPRCAAEITFKTDPKNTDYVCENGALRNFEPWREERIANEEHQTKKQKEEEHDPMKALENRTAESKREMDVLDSLDEIRTMNARNERVTIESALERVRQMADRERKEEHSRDPTALTEEDEALVASVFGAGGSAYVRDAIELDEEYDESEELPSHDGPLPAPGSVPGLAASSDAQASASNGSGPRSGLPGGSVEDGEERVKYVRRIQDDDDDNDQVDSNGAGGISKKVSLAAAVVAPTKRKLDSSLLGIVAANPSKKTKVNDSASSASSKPGNPPAPKSTPAKPSTAAAPPISNVGSLLAAYGDDSDDE
jgi:hypothetical protein